MNHREAFCRDRRDGHRRGMGRCLVYSAVLAVGAAIYAAGCSAPATSTAKPLGSGHPLPSWIGPGAKQEALRKQVDADAFPTAAQAGL